ncbi:MAG: hypothetical protein Q4D16_23395, partial [Eubacteriales bacterium]|nr:hypothetical protein [Eubacteriales bacterium]
VRFLEGKAVVIPPTHSITEHHSWQGLLTGTNQPRTAFRSTLDCILLMNHAMQGKRSQRKQA